MDIIITENGLYRNLMNMKSNDYVLPKFLYSKLKEKRTSLGDNPCFPEESKYSFDYEIIKDRYKEIVDKLNTIDEARGKSLNEIKTLCNKMLHECMQIERSYRDYLEKLCLNIVKKILYVPDETIIFKCTLVDDVNPKKAPRILPEDDVENVYTFDDVDDIVNSNKTVLKRRFINSLIQGAAYSFSLRWDEYIDEISKYEPKLIDLYRKIIILSDYILFNEEEKIDEKNLNLGAYVAVTLGKLGNKTKISAQGLIFPYLLRETIRGVFELFASHSLPQDNEKAMYLIRHADFMMAESWDLRFGVSLWNRLVKTIDEDVIIPYFFTELCNLDTEEFNSDVKEILSNTRKGDSIISNLVSQCKKNISFDKMPTNIDTQNIKSVISDEVEGDDIFTIDELNNLLKK